MLKSISRLHTLSTQTHISTSGWRDRISILTADKRLIYMLTTQILTTQAKRPNKVLSNYTIMLWPAQDAKRNGPLMILLDHGMISSEHLQNMKHSNRNSQVAKQVNVQARTFKRQMMPSLI